MTQTQSKPQTGVASALRSFVGAPFDPWTYRSLAYLLLAIPLGLLYFVVLTTGASLTLGLSITLLGPVAFVLTLLLLCALAWGDARLTGELLSVDLDATFPSTDDGVAPFLKELVLGRSTWRGIGFLLWRAVLGFLALAFLAVAGSITVELLLAPIGYGEHLRIHAFGAAYAIDTFERALLASGGGLVLAFLTLAGVKLVGHASAAVATALLGVGSGSASTGADLRAGPDEGGDGIE
ncbi:MAG: sensor domain-containing protein [Haloferacaceae archaeon]